jgi:hypothetical protein
VIDPILAHRACASFESRKLADEPPIIEQVSPVGGEQRQAVEINLRSIAIAVTNRDAAFRESICYPSGAVFIGPSRRDSVFLQRR